MKPEANALWLFRRRTSPIEALRFGNYIAIPPCKPLTFLERYFHEAGHIIGWNLSFKDRDVLTPDEAKIAKVANIDFKTRAMVLTALKLNIPGQEKLLFDFANSILDTFTKRNFDLSVIRVHYNFPRERLDKIARRMQKKATTYIVTNTGEIQLTSSRDGRNDEIPSYATMRACIKIMENTLDLPLIKYHKIGEGFSSSHARAFNIVDRAYTQNGIILPSYLDVVGKNY